MYSIGQVAEMFGMPISTLRYYDKQGLFPNMERVSGIRKFSEQEIEALRVIECLKKADMEIKDIRQFMDWCSEGSSTYPQHKAMFEERKAHMEAEIAHMNRALDMLKFKCWYYEHIRLRISTSSTCGRKLQWLLKRILLFSARCVIIGIYRKQKKGGRVHAKTATVPSDLWRTTS